VPESAGAVVVKNHGSKKVQVVHDSVHHETQFGAVVVLFSDHAVMGVWVLSVLNHFI
jgi:hypothetical protein